MELLNGKFIVVEYECKLFTLLTFSFSHLFSTGRADDQVKIRGFRIELGEIDTHLSQHPLVRENVTLVRRDKYEEQTLVSYFVPLEAPKDMAELLKVIREYLRLKLPSYAVPSGKSMKTISLGLFFSSLSKQKPF